MFAVCCSCAWLGNVCHLIAIDPVRPCGRLMLAFPVIVAQQVRHRIGIVHRTVRNMLLFDGTVTAVWAFLDVVVSFLALETSSIRLRWVTILRTPSIAPLNSVL